MYDTLTKRLKKVLNIDRELSSQEKERIVFWKESYNFKDDIIVEAGKKAMKVNKPYFRYIDGILNNWKKNNVSTYSDIIALDIKYTQGNEKKDKNEQIKVKIKKLTETAKLPTRGSIEAAGYDLYADLKEPVYIKPHEVQKIGTGLAIAVPKGYFGAIFARSGLAAKEQLAPANCVGVCDSDYRGEYIVALINNGNEVRVVNSGDRIAQLVIMPFLSVDFEEGNLDDTDRGDGGFGSTGR